MFSFLKIRLKILFATRFILFIFIKNRSFQSYTPFTEQLSLNVFHLYVSAPLDCFSAAFFVPFGTFFLTFLQQKKDAEKLLPQEKSAFSLPHSVLHLTWMPVPKVVFAL